VILVCAFVGFATLSSLAGGKNKFTVQVYDEFQREPLANVESNILGSRGHQRTRSAPSPGCDKNNLRLQKNNERTFTQPEAIQESDSDVVIVLIGNTPTNTEQSQLKRRKTVNKADRPQLQEMLNNPAMRNGIETHYTSEANDTLKKEWRDNQAYWAQSYNNSRRCSFNCLVPWGLTVALLSVASRFIPVDQCFPIQNRNIFG
jgi:hypothetical protein